MAYINEHEGPFALFKGLAPQITKGILVQGLLMMTKERYFIPKILLKEASANLFLSGWKSFSCFFLPTFAKFEIRD